MKTATVTHVEQYENEYSALGDALGKPDVFPAPGEVEFLAAITAQDWRGVGMLVPADVFFAAAVTSILAPPMAIEIGTASGFSAAILAKMIALRETERGAIGTRPLVQTIDKRTDFAFDTSKPVGFAIDLLTPELRDRIVVNPAHDSSYAQTLARNGEVKFAFIDGNHRHPWPLTDLLRLQQLMESGWILLHDIDLPETIARAQAEGNAVDLEPAFGAKHLFDLWPEEKIESGNIGLIKIPQDRRSLGDFVRKMRELPAEVSPGSWKKQWREIDSLGLRP